MFYTYDTIAKTSYFGARKVRGKRGKDTSRKTPVSGILKRDYKAYNQIIKNCLIKELSPIIQEKTTPDTVVYSDDFKA